MTNKNRFISFKEDIEEIKLPTLFNFPFYYQAHEIVKVAAEQVQEYLITQKDWKHNFGLNQNDTGLIIGKMFGVLVVQNEKNELGFLAAYSGKLADSNEHDYFVPPVFDMLTKDGFYRAEEKIVMSLNTQVEEIESNTEYQNIKKYFESQSEVAKAEIEKAKIELREQKKQRKIRRNEASTSLSETDFEILKEELKDESLKQQYFFKKLKKQWKENLEDSEKKYKKFAEKITALKIERRQRSNQLQQRLFDNYKFLNAEGNHKSLQTIFGQELNITPPAGAGECAAPKLLHYAYKNNLKPIALGEFWWGQSPKSEIRKHKIFYPSCRNKCEPILGFMLQGLEVEENPMLNNPAEGKKLEIFYEDEYLLLVNKPAEFLSVPGRKIKDSVQTRIQKKYPNSVPVHRLDQSTSGLLIIARDRDSYNHLQKQFIKRTVNKRYVAVLDGILKEKTGLIDLPLRVDLDNRPHQLVCYEHGKNAQTKYEVLEIKDGKTRVHFFPLTGRTHQLRVHAAHQNGLNAPIIGDDLYGKKTNCLHLHAEYLEFIHPHTKERVSFFVEAEF
ncbi:23S RNA-specific pseudouridylate synthase [Bernardetia litoralis DSM 6794]|uniref:23S RNA-specific pseudouridylate synthase n=1 Tax=Bernardetia litoralis (strain ATCC 23117 / DSM 6794 / NBRC 15988 / NCIMB 1366 / Fx l1 / Sio-4) TaxID=880071 RepID=I4ALC6_BERLS|nr:RluA family pseudouridine synthase [Bernardetia litoralis]AFM04761.1 23S RNA-specific pseudouridylate synthase [Bernardetia litoralis DSM 6794]